MAYRTINVTDGTYERLVYYKHGNMTFDDTLNKLMDHISEEDFYRSILKEHKGIVEEMKNGQYMTQEEFEDYIDQ
ncbi:MAG: hypothetical protein QCI82_00725 [Candidatus Thermoplasmatota archaeon]|nr:hypothetical protein [Candidatus Thermoplasmatota archaeon]